ncbi:agmatinase [Novosphingobium ginsenosidimutans]|uniref:Agmatinase n=1 Tax=Novosphingobium ginsenosidimutans TaxID=1176536 RepID=A0A5B8S0H1_9SPHN|nr:agmatinase [Novosphingobium ginsenosidimutans]QEA14678.1 agmatinase [Novosphingobium ginsenosidimutans]
MLTPTFHLIGLPTDCNSSFARGAAAAPKAIRAALWSDRGNLAAEDGQEIGHDFLLEDHGDLPLTETAGDDAIIRTAVTESLNAGAIPLLLGGDHAVSFPVVEAIAARHGPVNILHFDAHPDIYDDFEGNPRSHASPFARILEAGLCRRLVQVGIRTLNRHCREQAARFGVEIVPIADFSPGKVAVLDGPLYISLDLDGIDPAEAPGVSHPEPGGLRTREVLAVLHAQTGRIVGADVVELNPRFDINDRTAILAAKLVREVAATAARNLR